MDIEARKAARKEAAVWCKWFAGGAIGVWAASYVFADGLGGVGAFALIASFPAIAIWLVFSISTIQPEPALPIEAPKTEAEIQAEEHERKRQEEADDQWWIRYPIAILQLGAAWYLWEFKPDLWWVSVVLVLSALVFMRELSCLLTALALAGLAIGFVSSFTLNTPAAIVLGACIVAYAIQSKR